MSAQVDRNALERLSKVPFVDYTLAYANNLVHSNRYSASAFDKGQAYASSLYNTAAQAQPLAIRVNNYANTTIDWAENKFPAAFTTTPQQVIDGVYNTKKSYENSMKERLTSSQKAIHELTEALGKTLQSLPGSQQAEHAVHLVQERANLATQTMVQHYDTIMHLIQSRRQELSADARKALEPLYQSLEKHYAHVRTFATDKDKPLVDRASAILQYTRAEGYPALTEAVDTIRKILKETTNMSNNNNHNHSAGNNYSTSNGNGTNNPNEYVQPYGKNAHSDLKQE